VPDVTEIAGDGAHIHLYILGKYCSEENGKHTAAREYEEGIAQHSGQPELVHTYYEEHCASHMSDG
jgi:hypothetical protein